MRYELIGKWKKGFAFDLHTLASTYLGPDEFGRERFDTTYSEMGELVNQLKYRGGKSAIPKIIELLKVISGIEKFDFIIPVPSSNKNRAFQPVDEIATALGKQRGVPVLIGFLAKESRGKELKNTTDPGEREKLLKDAIEIIGDRKVKDKNVLLIDDLYRSGATLNACCSVLYEEAGVKRVVVLTMTKTRTKR